MCYSAQIKASYTKYVRAFGATMRIEEFFDVFWQRRADSSIQIPKALEAEFLHPQTEGERRIKAEVDWFAGQQKAKFETEITRQSERLAKAQSKLAIKTSKTAQDDLRIASRKIDWAKGKIADLLATSVQASDSRIFPGWYAPVMVMEHGQRVVKLMRYQCRPAGKPAWYDSKFPGTYNARRDSLQGFWSKQFGYTHGVAIFDSFYEVVERHRAEGRSLAPDERVEKVVVEFKPQPEQELLVACIWSRWTSPGAPDLLSFAAITDEPPAEVLAVGHDRCIIPIKPENIDAWLNPDPRYLAAQHAILDDRVRPFYRHKIADG